MALSDRAKTWAQPSDGNLIWKILPNLWHPETNPNGFVSLGVAENALMHDVLSQHIKTNLNPPNAAFTYGDGPRGSNRLRAAMARFLTKHLKPLQAIKSEHIVVTNGCTSALEHVAFALANPGEGFLLGQPYYGAFINDLSLRSDTFVKTVGFGEVDPFCLEAVRKYEDALLSSQKEGRKIAGLVLCHPHNPLGRCYPRETIIALMRLCEKYKIHLISDEIYALSVFQNHVDRSPEPVQFESVLSIDPCGIVDPSRLHVIWGMSKDFGANGLRLGAFISQRNPTLHDALMSATLYSSPSSLTEHATVNILEDSKWVERYIAENQRKLSEHCSLVTRWAKEHNITYAPGANAAFFLWVDLGKAYYARNPERKVDDVTQEIMDALIENKVFLASGKVFGSEKPGWFRIVFTNERRYLEEGLGRIIKALGDGTTKSGVRSKL